MTSPRRLLLVLPLAVAAALPATFADAAATRTFKVPCSNADATGWKYMVKPPSCTVYDATSADLTTFTPKGLKWKHWGKATTTATGTLKAKAYSGKIEVKATKLKQCSSKLSVYTQLTVSIPKAGAIAQFSAVPCPK